MADFFSRLAERALGIGASAQPKLPSMFGPASHMEVTTEGAAQPANARTDRVTLVDGFPTINKQQLSNSQPPAPLLPVLNHPTVSAESFRAPRNYSMPERLSKSDAALELESQPFVDIGAPAQSATKQARPKPLEEFGNSITPATVPDHGSLMATRADKISPTVQVSIGRVEVRAFTPNAAVARAIAERRRPPLLSLEEYLRQRNEGRR